MVGIKTDLVLYKYGFVIVKPASAPECHLCNTPVYETAMPTDKRGKNPVELTSYLFRTILYFQCERMITSYQLATHMLVSEWVVGDSDVCYVRDSLLPRLSVFSDIRHFFAASMP